MQGTLEVRADCGALDGRIHTVVTRQRSRRAVLAMPSTAQSVAVLLAGLLLAACVTLAVLSWLERSA